MYNYTNREGIITNNSISKNKQLNTSWWIGAYDSEHEYWFELYLRELFQKGIILKYRYQPKSLLLLEPVKTTYLQVMKTKTKLMESHLLAHVTYTMDFSIIWNPKAFFLFSILNEEPNFTKAFIAQKWNNKIVSFIDIKSPGYAIAIDASMVKFPILQKIVYDKKGMYINKTILFDENNPKYKPHLFTNTFTPFKYAFRNRKNGKGFLKCNCKVKTIDEYLKENNYEK